MMKALRALVGLAAREDASTDELTPSLQMAEAEVTAAHEAAAAAGEAYKQSMLTADDSALRKLKDACTDAAIRIDRAEELVRVLRERLAGAQDREEEARRVEVYQAAKRQSEEAQQALIEWYPNFANGLADLLRGVAEAEIAVSLANEKLPRGAAPLRSVERSVRDDPGTPEKILAEEIVTIWCRPGDLRHDSVGQKYVQFTADRRGYVQPPAGQIEHLVARTFKVTRYVPAYAANAPDSLAAELSLPGLKAGDPTIFKAFDLRHEVVSPDRVLKRLAVAAAAGQSKPARPAEEERYELVGEYDTEAEKNRPVSMFDRIPRRA